MTNAFADNSWALLDENGGTALTFTSLMDIRYSNEGQALSYPVEQGGFAGYNKTQNPLDIQVKLGMQGSEADFSHMQEKLDEYAKKAVTLTVVTPSAVYPNMTLRGHSFGRSGESGAGMLEADLRLVEVREVQTQTSAGVISGPKNPTSAPKVDIGRVQTREVDPAIFFSG